MNPAKHDDVRIGAGRLLGEQEGIPAKIGNLLNFVTLVVMSQNDSVLLFLEAQNPFLKLSVLLLLAL
ncbi:hypothetical protein D3C73_1401060 [compost metagenome]